MRHTRNKQLELLGVCYSGKNFTISRMQQKPQLDKTFMWLRISYEGDKKVRNYWGIAGTYARKIK
ncbi:hypothetical protein COJ38_21475 [Bacillus cereus]|uniref:hypothetical protein n=1 Tax=Bacillus cereus TaxID=1396 RepID=UPI000BF6F415|nr:hypothetical protein [Bacillus cereus]PFL86607.1 hypothetical protein COJ38_21475 [Bacillus cereus]